MSSYDEFDLYGLQSDLEASGDLVGAKTAQECASVIEDLKSALEYIASGSSLDPVSFATNILKRFER